MSEIELNSRRLLDVAKSLVIKVINVVTSLLVLSDLGAPFASLLFSVIKLKLMELLIELNGLDSGLSGGVDGGPGGPGGGHGGGHGDGHSGGQGVGHSGDENQERADSDGGMARSGGGFNGGAGLNGDMAVDTTDNIGSSVSVSVGGISSDKKDDDQGETAIEGDNNLSRERDPASDSSVPESEKFPKTGELGGINLSSMETLSSMTALIEDMTGKALAPVTWTMLRERTDSLNSLETTMTSMRM